MPNGEPLSAWRANPRRCGKATFPLRDPLIGALLRYSVGFRFATQLRTFSKHTPVGAGEKN